MTFHLNHRYLPQNDWSHPPLQFDLITSLKLLGIEIGSTLTWLPHITKFLSRKKCDAFYVLWTILSYVISFRTSYVIGLFPISFFVWHHIFGNLNWGHINVFRMQKKVTMLMAKSRFNSDLHHFDNISGDRKSFPFSS